MLFCWLVSYASNKRLSQAQAWARARECVAGNRRKEEKEGQMGMRGKAISFILALTGCFIIWAVCTVITLVKLNSRFFTIYVFLLLLQYIFQFWFSPAASIFGEHHRYWGSSHSSAEYRGTAALWLLRRLCFYIQQSARPGTFLHATTWTAGCWVMQLRVIKYILSEILGLGYKFTKILCYVSSGPGGREGI